jgi:hypothetical protein
MRMPQTLHEYMGVILSVDSTQGTPEDPMPTLTSVRVLGADYKPCGPNLVEMLDQLAVPIVFPTTGNISLTPFLSLVTKEIYDQRSNPHSANQ